MPDQVDFTYLLGRMTNVSTFAEAPLGNSFLESSYDRSGGNQDWAVYTQAEPSGRITLFNAEGPGYLSRFWIASFAAKKWLFFFDGEEEPRLTLTKSEFFGGKYPFIAPLAGLSGGGRYSLVPIPFRKSLRIEIEPTNLKPGNRNYYHINYTKLDLPAENVQSFPRSLTLSESNLVDSVNSGFKNSEGILRAALNAMSDDLKQNELAPGEAAEVWRDDGAGVLKAFSLRIDHPKASIAMHQELLRTLRIQMFWDGMDTPSVDVPLGDFFCNPFYFRSFASMPMGYVDGAYICRFPMPYARGATVQVLNTSAYPVHVSIAAAGNTEHNEGLTRKFHSVWRASTTSGRPLHIMEATGSGHYVGCFMSAIGQDGSWNILEGDEYIRPDYGTQPMQLGTGLEDYFNGAYYYTSLFDLPFHGLIEKGAMRTDQYRFHMLEAVAFDESIDMGIEFGHGNKSKGYLSSVAYWYMDDVMGLPLNPNDIHLLARPADRFELPGLMAQFFQLERAELYEDAASRMDYFAERYNAQPWGELFKVRALGYREKIDGFEVLKSEYEKLTQSKFPPAAKAAEDILWIHEHPDNALLGIHALAKFKVSMDGMAVAEGEGRGNLHVVRVKAPDGEHRWEAELQPTRQGGFVTLYLKKANANASSAGEWEVMEKQVQEGIRIPPVVKGSQVLPNMTVWALEPNAYVDMQSPPAGIPLWRFYEGAPMYKGLKIKKTFLLESGSGSGGPLTEEERSDAEMKANAVNVE